MVQHLGASSEANGAVAPGRRAFYLASRGGPAFAWWHEPAAASIHGVLICPPVLFKHVHTHRAVRHLAEDLASAGMAVCRLDYHGVGDSSGIDEDPDRLATWEANIRDAIRWMRDVRGCQRLSLVGIRLGGLLALKATQETPVDDLVLWAPVVKGRMFVREMQALSLTSAPAEAAEASNDIEAAGFVMSEQTARDLSAVDALTLRPQCRRALIVARDDLSEDRRLFDHLASLTIDAQQTRQPGYLDMVVEPHKTAVPQQAITSIASWLSADDRSAAASPSARSTDWPAQMTGDGYCDRIVRIDGPPELIGILTEPTTACKEDRPLIVLLNAGAAYRVGPNRLYVLLARQLGRVGFRVLRVDISGLGDSLCANPAVENSSYPETIFRDIDLVFQHATAHLGARRIVLAGLCSGAYAAFQAAAQFANPALVECLLINPLTYFWKEGMSLEMPEIKEHAAFQYYARSALRPEKWWKLITGQSKIGIVGALKMLGRRLRRRDRPELANAGVSPCRYNDADIKHPERDDPAADLQRAAAAGRHLTFIFSADDPGYSLLMHHARRSVKSLTRKGVIDLIFIPAADHTFSRRQPRRTAIEAICGHLVKRFPASRSTPLGAFESRRADNR